VKLLHGPTESGQMKTRHNSSAYTAAAVVLRAAVDTVAPFVSRENHPTAVMFSSGLDVRDEICDYINKNDIDLVIIGRRSVESKRACACLACCIERAPASACVFAHAPLVFPACAAKVRRPSVGSVSSFVLHHASAAVLVVNETTLHAGFM
jgi:nucleotide-binding universal stress UspA family protein